MQVYINYPNAHITIHNEVSCQQIHMHQKPGQRLILIHVTNLKSVLSDFIADKIDFKSEHKFNDLWLDISLDTSNQEFGLVYVLQALLGQRYKPLANAPVSVHCK